MLISKLLNPLVENSQISYTDSSLEEFAGFLMIFVCMKNKQMFEQFELLQIHLVFFLTVMHNLNLGRGKNPGAWHQVLVEWRRGFEPWEH